MLRSLSLIRRPLTSAAMMQPVKKVYHPIPLFCNNIVARFSSTTDDDDDKIHSNFTPEAEITNSKFAAVNHGQAYEDNWQGLHGRQLSAAQREGLGKDDPDFDPFSDDEDDDEYNDENEMQLDDDNTIDVNFTEKKADSANITSSSVDGKADNKVVRKNDGKDNNLENDDYDSSDDDEDDELDDDSLSSLSQLYNNDGSLKRTKTEKAILRAGAPAGGVFAIIELAGTQFKITTDDLLIVNRLKPLDKFKVGSIHTLHNVLLTGTSHLTLVGMPYVAGAEVDIMIEEITRDAKVVVFKKRRRKHSQRRNGFRRDITMLRILDIRLPEPYDEHEHRERLDPNTLGASMMEDNDEEFAV